MKQVPIAFPTGRWTYAALAAVFLVTGCSLAEHENKTRDDVYVETIRSLHPIGVEETMESLNIAGSVGDANLNSIELRRVGEFVDRYRANGYGELAITIPAAAASDTNTLGRAKQVADVARQRGLSSGQVMLRIDTADQRTDGPVMLSYERLSVILPACGDWSRESAFDYNNRISPNLGCASQRNTGLMIAQPADILAQRATTPRDTAMSNRVIQLWRAGEVTRSERDEGDEASFADVE